MSKHPIVIKISKGGATTTAYHPSQADQIDALLAGLGETTEDARGGHVLPQHWLKRAVFKAFRRLFGNEGRVSDWTRGWKGPWVIVSAKSGNTLPGHYRTHDDAVRSEVAFIIRGDGDIDLGKRRVRNNTQTTHEITADALLRLLS